MKAGQIRRSGGFSDLQKRQDFEGRAPRLQGDFWSRLIPLQINLHDCMTSSEIFGQEKCFLAASPESL